MALQCCDLIFALNHPLAESLHRQAHLLLDLDVLPDVSLVRCQLLVVTRVQREALRAARHGTIGVEAVRKRRHDVFAAHKSFFSIFHLHLHQHLQTCPNVRDESLRRHFFIQQEFSFLRLEVLFAQLVDLILAAHFDLQIQVEQLFSDLSVARKTFGNWLNQPADVETFFLKHGLIVLRILKGRL